MRPSREALLTEYQSRTQVELAGLYKVTERTVQRWFSHYEIDARAIAPERRSGGRRYRRTNKLPQHTTLEQAEALREQHRAHPEWTARELREATGCTCSLSMVRMILRGERIAPMNATEKHESGSTGLSWFGG